MTPFRYDGSNSQPELPGLNVFDYSRADFAVDEYVYYPVWYLKVADFLWSLKCHQQTSEQAELCHDTNRPFLQLVQQRSLPTTQHLQWRRYIQRSRSPGVVTCGKYLVTHLRRHIP